MDCYHDMLRPLVCHRFFFTAWTSELTHFHCHRVNRPKIHYQFSLLIHTFSRVFSLMVQYGEGYDDLATVDDAPLSSPMPLRLPCVMSVTSPTSPYPTALARRVIIAQCLLLRIAQEPTVSFKFSFTVTYQLRSGLSAGAPVLHIVTLPAVHATSIISSTETTDLNWPMSIRRGVS
jgi:hypothetical protein